MVLGILVAVIAAPGLLGSQEAIRQSQSQEKREEHRARRCNLIATCVKSSMRSREINGRPVVLKNGKLWIDTGTSTGTPYGHPYAGYYLPYPDTSYEGLVTTITDEAPIMNWVYIDKSTYEVKYGVRANAQPNLTGPFDCTRQDRRLTFDGWEGFCAVEEFPTLWALYFDVDDDGLKGKVGEGMRVLEIELARKEKRWAKEGGVRVADQTTKREVEVKEETPVDKPMGVEPEAQHPGVGDEKESSKPKPLAIPKSIFPDARWLSKPLPPLSRPMTPPPAYKVEPDLNPPNQSARGGEPPSNLSLDKDTTKSPALKATHIMSSPESTEEFETIQHAPSSEKHTTPKLNRNSGSKALAKAQIFERMAQQTDPPTQLSRPTSNQTSITDFVSGYLDEISGEETPTTLLARPDSSVLTLSTPKLSANPVITGGDTERMDPAIFGMSTRKEPEVRERLKRSMISNPKTEPAKPPSLSRTTTRQRGASASSQNKAFTAPSPKPLTRTATLPNQSKRSMAATMTSGVKTSMARRMTPQTASTQPRRDRSNSNLYREIDSMLQPKRKAPARPTVSRSAPRSGSRDRKPSISRQADAMKAPIRGVDSSRTGLGRPARLQSVSKRSSKEIN